MEEIPSKPYLIRALHEWCSDNGYTPYILVNAGPDTRVPRAHVRNGQITLNIGTLATQHLMLDNEHITFQARFSGVIEHVFVPTSAVVAIYARETGAGMGFEIVQTEKTSDAANPTSASATPSSSAAQTTNAPTNPHLTVSTTDTLAATPQPDDPPPGPPRRPKLTIVK